MGPVVFARARAMGGLQAAGWRASTSWCCICLLSWPGCQIRFDMGHFAGSDSVKPLKLLTTCGFLAPLAAARVL